MAEDKISSFIDKQAIKKQADFLSKILDDLFSKYERINTTKLTLEGSKTFSDTAKQIQALNAQITDLQNTNAKLSASQQVIAQSQRAINQETAKTVEATKQQSAATRELLEISARNEVVQKQLTESKKELAELFKKGAIDEKEYIALLADIKEQQIQVSVTSQAVTTALKNIEKESQAADGSLDKLRAQLNLSLITFDKLNETEKNSTIGTELLQKIQGLTKEISAQEQLTGRFQRNVGNYAGSLAKPFESLIGLVNKLKDDVKNGIGIGGKTDQQSIQKTEALIQSLEGNIEKAGKAGATAAKQVVQLQNAFASVSLSTSTLEGDTTLTSFVDRFGKEVGQAKDQVRDLQDEIKLNASDTKGIDNVVGSLNALAGVAQGAASAYSIFGGSQEDAAKTTAKLLAIQGIANSIQQVGQELTRKGTTANKVYEFSQKQLALAFDSTAAASVRLKAALISIGIGGLIVLAGLLITNFEKVKNAISGVSKEQATLNELNEKAIDNYTEEKTKVSLLVAEYQAAGTSQKRKKDIQKELQDDYPNYFGNLKTEKEFADGLTTAYEKLSRALYLKAKVQAATSIISENEGKALKEELKKQEALADEAGLKYASGLANSGLEAYKEQVKTNFDKRAESFREGNKFLLETILNSQKEIDALSGDPNGGKNKKKTDKKDDTAERNRKAEFDAQQAQREALAKLFKTVADDEKRSLDDRLDSLQLYIAAREQIITKQAEFETGKKGLTANEQAEIEVKKNLALLDAEREYGKQRLDIIKANSDAEINARVEAFEERKKNAENNFKKEQEATQGIADREIERLNIRLRFGLITVGEYEEQKKKIQDNVKRQSIQDELNFYANLIQIFKDFGFDTTELEKKLADARRKISQLDTDEYIDDQKKKADATAKRTKQEEEDEKKLAAARKKLAQEVETAIKSFVTGNFERQKNAVQEQIDLNDQKAEKEIQAIENSTGSEQKKANAIAVIQARQKADRDRLEREKRRIDQDRARFEKAASIVKVIADTASAVAEALPNIPLSILVGAIGAAQIATILAQPIPKYKHGIGFNGESHPGGPMIVGDGYKSESIFLPSGQVIMSPSTPTLMTAPKGTTVYPDHEKLMDMIQWNAISNTRVPAYTKQTKTHNDNMELVKEIRSLKTVIQNKKENHFHGPKMRDIMFGEGNKFNRYLNDNLQG